MARLWTGSQEILLLSTAIRPALGDQPVNILWHRIKNLSESCHLDSSTGRTRGLYSYWATSSYTEQPSVRRTFVLYCSSEQMGTIIQCVAVNVRWGTKWTTIIRTQTDRQTDRTLPQNTWSLNPTALQPATPFAHQGVSPLPAHSAIRVWLDCTQYALLRGQNDQCINQTAVECLVLSLIPPL